jgi:hypothetical protein
MGELPEQVPSLTPSINPLQPVQSTFAKTQSDPSTAAARKLDSTVARVSPALYAAGSRAALTREEKNLIENWAKVRDTHKQLMKMSNEDAGDSYNKLEPGFQEVLKTYYKVDYANKTESSALIQNEALRKALGIEDNDFEFLDAIKSPFKFLMGAALRFPKPSINLCRSPIRETFLGLGSDMSLSIGSLFTSSGNVANVTTRQMND